MKILQDVEALQALERRRDVHWVYQMSRSPQTKRGARSLLPVTDEDGNDPIKGPCDAKNTPGLRSPDVDVRVGALRACMEALTYSLGDHPNLWRRVDQTCMLYTWSDAEAKLNGLSDQSHGPDYKWATITEFQGRRELRAAVDWAKGAAMSLPDTQDAKGNAIDPAWENPAELPLVQDMVTAIAGSLVGVDFRNFVWRRGGGNRQYPGHEAIRNRIRDRLRQAGHVLPTADLNGLRKLAVALGAQFPDNTHARYPDLGAAVWAPLYAGAPNAHWTLPCATTHRSDAHACIRR